jgi:hypothetical protein
VDSLDELRTELTDIARTEIHSVPRAIDRVTDVQLVPDGRSDTAYYDLIRKRIVFTEALGETLVEAPLSKDAKRACAAAVIAHEAFHAAWTRYWPAYRNPLASQVINHLEDWRIDRAAVTFDPSRAGAFRKFFNLISEKRGEAEQAHGTVDIPPHREFLDFWTSLWVPSLYPKSFRDHYTAAASRIEHPRARAFAEEIEPYALACYEAQPDDPFDFISLKEASRDWVASANIIADRFIKYFELENAEDVSKSLSPEELKKLIRDVLKQRQKQQKEKGKSGQQQEQSMEGGAAEKGNDGGGKGHGDGGGESAEQDSPSEGISGSSSSSGNGKESDTGSERDDTGKGAGSAGESAESSHGNRSEEGDGVGRGDQEAESSPSRSQKDAIGHKGDAPTDDKQERSVGRRSDDVAEERDTGVEDARKLLEQMPSEVLEDLLDALEEGYGHGAPDGAQEVPLGKEFDASSRDDAEEKNHYSRGYNRATGDGKLIEVPKGDLRRSQAALSDNRQLIDRAQRLLANSISSTTLDSGPPSEVAAQTGSIISPGAIARRLDNPFSNEPPFLNDEPTFVETGKLAPNYDHFIVAIDGSGSMNPCWSRVQQFLLVLREATAKFNIPVVAVLNNGNNTGIICHGSTSPASRMEDLRRIVGMKCDGGTDLASSSLTTTAKLVQKARPNLSRSRLVIISDCNCGMEDVNESARHRMRIAAPSLLIGFGSHPAQFQSCDATIRSAARICNQPHGGILYDYSGNPKEAFETMFFEFCKWAQNPNLYPIAPQIVGNPLTVDIANEIPESLSLQTSSHDGRLTKNR